jgi:hypothetical protein
VVSVRPLPLYLQERETVPFEQETGWASGPIWMRPENLAPTGVRTPDCPARSQSRYRLRYPGRQFNTFSSSMKKILQFMADDVNKFKISGAFAKLGKATTSFVYTEQLVYHWTDFD